MNEGMENLKELEKLELVIKKFKQLVTEKESRISELEAINKHHQKINGELQEKVSKYQNTAAHYRRKGVL